MGWGSSVFGQVQPPNPTRLFKEDLRDSKMRAKSIQQSILRRDPVKENDGTYFKAPDVTYDQVTGDFIGTGGVIINYGGNQIQGDSGKFNSKTNKGELSGGLVLTSPGGELRAGSGKFDLVEETGVFSDASVVLDGDGYAIEGGTIERLSDDEYRITDAEMTTCQCADGSKPWSISSPDINIEVEGYAKARPFFFECNDVPIFYSPYMIFPAKFQRASGLLVPQIGFSNRNGFEYSQPIFVAVNDNADMMIEPFVETETRYGISTRYTQKFSMRSDLDAKLTFSDESLRDGDLRGTQTAGLYDPTFDEQRTGGFLKYRWQAKEGEIPYSINVDGRYVSDDLYLREIDDPLLGLAQDRFMTSRAYLSVPLGDYMNADIGSEYTQSFVSNDDEIFQRLPALSIDGYKSWRVFGTNPYGLKLITSGDISAVSYDRKTGYEGDRMEINPKLKIPFYYKSFVNGSMQLGARQTYYELGDTFDPKGELDLADSSDRSLYNIGFSLDTVLERVYESGPDTMLGRITSTKNKLGKPNNLQRVKHTIEPFIKYGYVPDEDQSNLPLFTQQDRIRTRNQFYYGINSRLIGRFSDSAQARGLIEELAPDANPFGFGVIQSDPSRVFEENFFNPSQSIKRIRGQKKELSLLSIRQSYDSEVDKEATGLDEFSDVAADLAFYPSDYFGIGFNSNLDHSDGTPSSYGLGLKLEDDRGDHLRTRLSYVDNVVSQLDGNLEIALTERLKLGFYGRYDDLVGDWMESRAAIRIISSCDCWKLDIGYRDQINPDNQSYTLLLTLRGLGDIGD
jgi:LPS-assembly protein